MIYLFLSLGLFGLALAGLYLLISCKPDRTIFKGMKITRKHLLLSVVFFLICSFSLYHFGYKASERKKAEYLEYFLFESDSIDKELNDNSDHVIQSRIENIEDDEAEDHADDKRIWKAKDRQNRKPSNVPILYENHEYGFTLTIPKSWEGKYSVVEENWIDEAETCITFYYHHDENKYYMFSLIIFDAQGYDFVHPMMSYITTHNDKVYVNIPAADPPPELVQSDETKPILDELMKMMNEDLPLILESITFY